MLNTWLRLSEGQVKALRIAVEDDLIQGHAMTRSDVRYAKPKTLMRLAALGLIKSFIYQGHIWYNPTRLGERVLRIVDHYKHTGTPEVDPAPVAIAAA